MVNGRWKILDCSRFTIFCQSVSIWLASVADNRIMLKPVSHNSIMVFVLLCTCVCVCASACMCVLKAYP